MALWMATTTPACLAGQTGPTHTTIRLSSPPRAVYAGFGNLVTMNWWDDLWLNEGFASWTENFATDQLFPDWRMWEQFTIDSQSAALNLDALRSSHPIQVPIAHAEEVEQVRCVALRCFGLASPLFEAERGRRRREEGCVIAPSLWY